MAGPVQRRPLYQEVERRLHDLIRAEDLQRGQKLASERELAKRLGVTRAAVRQALTAMRAAGIVEIRHGDGIYLLRETSEFLGSLAKGLVESHAHLPAINEVREAIEPHAARLAARRRTQGDLTEMASALDDMREQIASDEAPVEGDARFHGAIVAAARNEVMSTLYGELAASWRESSHASLVRPDQPARSLAEHEAILEAIVAGDEQRAELSMRLHVYDFSDLRIAPRRRAT